MASLEVLAAIVDSNKILNAKIISVVARIKSMIELSPPADPLQHLEIARALIKLPSISSMTANSNHHQSHQGALSLSEDSACLLAEVCLPLLHADFMTKENAHCVIDILATVFPLLPPSTRAVILEACCASLEKYIREQSATYFEAEPGVVAMLALDLLSNFSVDFFSNDWKARVLAVLEEILRKGEGRVACHAINMLTPLLRDDPQLLPLWRCVRSVFHSHGSDDSCSQALLLLCALADLFLPPCGPPGPITQLLAEEDSFWEILQSGLSSPSPLTRKRTSYLLKRIMDALHSNHVSVTPSFSDALFQWDAGLGMEQCVVWDALVLVAETLEEKQIHVIKPVLDSRMKDVLLSAALRSACAGKVSVHVTWLTSLLVRMSHHESVAVKEWAVKFTLSMHLTSDHLSDPRVLKFILGPFMKMLTDSKVYHSCLQRPSVARIKGFPAMDTALPAFFSRCHSELSGHKREKFFEDFFKGMSDEAWDGSCLVFIFQGLSQLPAEPVLGPEVLSCVRKLLTTSCSTVELHVRGALHCFFLRTLMRIIDTERVNPEAFASVLCVISAAEALQRGEALWQEVSQWMAAQSHEAWSPEAMLQSLQHDCAEHLMSAENEVASSVQLSRMLLLALDAHVVSHEHLQLILRPVVELIASAGTRVYLDASRVNRALLLISSLLEEMRCGCDEEVIAMLSGCIVESFMAFATRQLTELQEVAHMTGINHQVAFLRAMLSVDKLRAVMWECAHTHTLLNTCVQSILAEQTTALSQQLSKHASLLFAVALSRHAPAHVRLNLKQTLFDRWLPVPCFMKPPDWVDKDSSSDDLQLGLTWGMLSSEHVSQQWALLSSHLGTEEGCGFRVSPACIDACLCTLDVLSPEALLPLLNCLKCILAEMPEEIQLRILQLAYTTLTEHVQNLSFWSLLDAFLPLILTEHKYEQLQLAADEWLSRLLELGQEKSGLANMLVQHLDRHLLLRPQLNLISCLQKTLLFGPVHSKGRRFSIEVHQYLLTLGEALPTNKLRDGSSRCDRMVRIRALSLLAKLSAAASRECHALLLALLRSLMLQLQQLQAVSGFKSYSNSLSHREKHRIVCAFFLLETVMNEEFVQTCFAEYVWSALKAESQPSVRVYLEWLIARLMLKHPFMQQAMWDVISQPTSEKKASYFSSVLCILSHLSKALDWPAPEQEAFYERAFPVVLPWCMAHHFTLRVYAQACLLSLWQHCSQRSLLLTRFHLLQHFVQQISSSGDHARVLLDNFTCLLHPICDLSIETLVSTLPRLCDIVETEWLSVESFDPIEGSVIPLRNPSPTLAQCQQGLWKVKSNKSETEVVTSSSAEGDIQKKIIPWQSMIPEQDLDLTSRKRVKRGGLVLVTSLIDKVPNLGGLCRTSEIFGVSEFVISNIGFTRDRGFESLSVTAEKWIPISEVPIARLKPYLESMRREGYTLAGAEQTAQSVSLTEYAFPEKTVLLLGNEKEGIPVELIQMLDVCIEIPQQGLIRSLNVHVSGALLIWEYTRQHLAAPSSS
ncbi:hypothetical protein CAPTEDRAFT_220697 [Capitella teleta]|uniref:tRNA (guanosine(18)-2'-O)-methyltransferase TARBP1 n=1 Tax=Capitella teleta TaxID=283909 RepID=R7UXG0_CAPTE|nr:hypothetical protein CAPTEDRAFT_220697 [Capitella teleta]|eukprot:ELU08602.1 hypothetical protein CAPTEDRAFT_220697 [Capitella teleta]